jgi:hypothetical protein
LFLVCSQDVSSTISAVVSPPDHTALDPLHQDVDPKLLVSSRGKGSPRRRKHLAHMPPGGSVNVHHILFALCEHADSESTYTLCRNPLRLNCFLWRWRKQEARELVLLPSLPTHLYCFATVANRPRVRHKVNTLIFF